MQFCLYQIIQDVRVHAEWDETSHGSSKAAGLVSEDERLPLTRGRQKSEAMAFVPEIPPLSLLYLYGKTISSIIHQSSPRHATMGPDLVAWSVYGWAWSITPLLPLLPLLITIQQRGGGKRIDNKPDLRVPPPSISPLYSAGQTIKKNNRDRICIC